MAKKKNASETLTLGDEQVEVGEPEVKESDNPEVAELERPSKLSPLWHDFIMTQFDESEVDNNGYPKVAGLRRVTERYVGNILNSTPEVISDVPGRSSVSYTITVHDAEIDAVRTFGDVADATQANVGDKAIGEHLLAVAGTRAEARALRKILGLRVLSSEEANLVKNADGSQKDVTNETGLITPEQINYMQVMCKRNNIDLWKYVNSGSGKYNSIETVPYKNAQDMLRYLTKVQNKSAVVEESIKGFDVNWRQNVKGGLA